MRSHGRFQVIQQAAVTEGGKALQRRGLFRRCAIGNDHRVVLVGLRETVEAFAIGLREIGIHQFRCLAGRGLERFMRGRESGRRGNKRLARGVGRVFHLSVGQVKDALAQHALAPAFIDRRGIRMRRAQRHDRRRMRQGQEHADQAERHDIAAPDALWINCPGFRDV
mgnify:CR=1 FL=1